MTNQGKNAIDMVLAESLKELAVTRPIDKITIKEITDKAGVIRPTFYNHFQDKYELLEWIVENELIDPAIPLLDNGMMREGLTLILTTMDRERGFYIKASRLEGQNSFPEILKKYMTRTILRYFDIDRMKADGMLGYSWATPEMIADIYAQSVVYIIVGWARDGMVIPIAELVEMYLAIVNRTAYDFVRETV